MKKLGTVTVLGTAQPWSTTANPTKTWDGSGVGSTGPTTFDVTGKKNILPQYVSGSMSKNGGSTFTANAGGYPPFPYIGGNGPNGASQYIVSSPVWYHNSGGILGAWVDASGVWIAGTTPFSIGNGHVLHPPQTGSSVYLAMGIDDLNTYADNLGSYTVDIYEVFYPTVCTTC